MLAKTKAELLERDLATKPGKSLVEKEAHIASLLDRWRATTDVAEGQRIKEDLDRFIFGQ